MRKHLRKLVWGIFLLTPILLHPVYLTAQTTVSGSGGGGGITIGTTPISGGATTEVLYNAAGVVSSDSGFTRGSGTTTISNGVAAVSPLVVMDNVTPVFTIADGGAITLASGVNISMSGQITGTTGFNMPDLGYVGDNTGTLGGLSRQSGLTPDAMFMYAGTTPNAMHFGEFADRTFDFNNGRCGTSACAAPSLIFHSSDQVTTEYAQISADTSGAAGFQSNFAEIRVGGTKTAITEASAQAIVRFGIPTSTNVFGATVFYTVYDINGANYTSRAGQVRVQGGNSGGTATCTINAGQDTEAEDGSQIATSNAATLTYTWTNVVSTTNCDLSLNAASSQGANTYAITWTAVVNGNSSAITVVGQ